MTLSTDIVIHQLTDILRLQDWVNTHLLNAPNAEGEYTDGGLYNKPGQGLSAWFSIIANGEEQVFGYEYEREDFQNLETGEWYSDEDGEQGWMDAQERDAVTRPIRTGYVKLNFDTAYGYSDDEGHGNATELHADFIVRLANEYFEPRGLTFAWKDEYTGFWYNGLDAAGLREFLGNGDSATDWFNNQVVPILSAEVAAEGGELYIEGQ